VATNSALTAVAVATGVIAPRLLGPSGEGELAAIQTWPMLLGTLAMLGLDSALVYFIARDPESGKQLTATATVIGLVIFPGRRYWMVCAAFLAIRPAARRDISGARLSAHRSSLRGGRDSARIPAWSEFIFHVEPLSPRPRSSLAVHSLR